MSTTDALFQPADYTENKRYWSGEDGHGAVLDAPDWAYYADDWCMWDTYRTSHPLRRPAEMLEVYRRLVAHGSRQ